MKHYLIDMENIGVSLTTRLPLIEMGDRIYIFHSDVTCKNGKALIELMAFCRRKGVVMNCLPVINGVRDALDFQLDSYLGYLIAQRNDTSDEYIIVSNDTGYKVVISFWKRAYPGVNITWLSPNNTAFEEPPPKPEESLLKNRLAELGEMSVEDENEKKKIRKKLAKYLNRLLNVKAHRIMSLFENLPSYEAVIKRIESKDKFEKFRSKVKKNEETFHQIYDLYWKFR